MIRVTPWLLLYKSVHADTNFFMRKRNQAPVILVDDPSPHAFSEDIMSRFSVDLARTSFGSIHSDLHLPIDVSPDFAVLEELESIRSMIENKSRDLSLRERTLSKSITHLNAEVSVAHELVEKLADNLLRNGEKQLHELHEVQSKKLNKLLSKVESRLKEYENVFSRIPRTAYSDAPPLPEARTESGYQLDSDRIFSLISSDSDSGKVAAACLLVVGCSSLTVSQSLFATNVLLHAALGVIRSKFDALFFQSIHSFDSADHEDPKSKFAAAKRSVLKKRLGVIDSHAPEGIKLVLKEDTLGKSSSVDVGTELDAECLVIWNDALRKCEKSEPPTQAPVRVRVLDDAKVQNLVCRQLKQKNRDRTVQSRLVDILLGGAGDRSLIDAMDAICWEVKNEPHRSARSVDLLTVALIFIMHRCLEEAKSDEVNNAVVDATVSLIESRSLQVQVGRVLAEWTQGIWYAFNILIKLGKGESVSPIHSLLVTVLESSESLACLAPWKETIIEKIAKNEIHPSIVSRLKPLTKRMSA